MYTFRKIEMMLIMNMLAGSIAYAVWRLMEKRLSGKDAVKYAYYGLKTVILLFAVPVLYIILVLKCWSFTMQAWIGPIIDMSPFTAAFFDCLGIIWASGGLWEAFRCGKMLLREYRFRKKCSICRKKETEILKQVCREMKIKTEIPVLATEEKHAPAIGGIFRPEIYLGHGVWEDQELRLIFRHELTHYRHRDLWIQGLLLLLRIVYWFHPLFFTGRIAEDNRSWSEDYCDYEVCRKEDMNAYIVTLLKVSIESAKARRAAGVSIAEKGSDVLRRIEKMESNRSEKKWKRWTAAAWSMAFFLAVGSTSYAAGSGLVEGYGLLCQVTEVATRVEQDPEPFYIEYTEAPGEEPEGIVIVEAEEENAGRSFPGSVNWMIKANMKTQSSSFEKKSGESIRVSVSVEPEDLNVDVGIIRSGGGITYITGSGDISHNFELDKSGTYQVFVRNGNSVKVEAVGFYKK